MQHIESLLHASFGNVQKEKHFHKKVRNDDVTPFKNSGKTACKWVMVYTGAFM